VRDAAIGCALLAIASELAPVDPSAKNTTRATASSEAAPAATYRRRAWGEKRGGTRQKGRAFGRECVGASA